MIDTVAAARVAREKAWAKAQRSYPEHSLMARHQCFVRECLVEFANLTLPGGYDELVQYPDSGKGKP